MYIEFLKSIYREGKAPPPNLSSLTVTPFKKLDPLNPAETQADSAEHCGLFKQLQERQDLEKDSGFGSFSTPGNFPIQDESGKSLGDASGSFDVLEDHGDRVKIRTANGENRYATKEQIQQSLKPTAGMKTDSASRIHESLLGEDI